MGIMDAAGSMTPEQIRMLIHCVERGFELLDIKGELYAASEFAGIGYWVFRVDPGSPEYFVDPVLRCCTCPMFKDRGRCKHLDAFPKRKKRKEPRPRSKR